MRIIQLSDIHLFSDEGELTTIHFNNFNRVVDFIIDNKHALNADFIIVTGDISHDGGLPSYDVFFNLMAKIGLPFYYLPGNHDNSINLCSSGVKHGAVSDTSLVYDEDWVVITIDSIFENEDFGFISNNSLRDLEHAANSAGGKNIALFMHHHLIPVGTPIVDDCMLRNASDVLELCLRLNIKFIGSGHAHTLFQRKIESALVSVCPAICSQWLNGTKEVNVVKNSGFNIVSLDDNIHIETWLI
ncbi:metallophosphoesterase family protein [Cedecea sp. NFIX57]|uniref:metallophosphoesterase family protein n=1 Tax=Cedecea sp. NFIX57 TaxID=1566286 RepID=UPI000A0B1BF7|nr:metallophosphoesterase [Cedecea sp. NFIX57]SMG55555.1 Icc protein [Cedecea sp. NFIX57]